VPHSDLLSRVVYHLMNHPFFIRHNFEEIISKNSEVYEISLISDEYGLYFIDNFSQLLTIQSNPEPKPGAWQPL
jgi:hypothetical protein